MKSSIGSSSTEISDAEIPFRMKVYRVLTVCNVSPLASTDSATTFPTHLLRRSKQEEKVNIEPHLGREAISNSITT